MEDLPPLSFVSLAAVLAPVFSSWTGQLRSPAVVFEIVLRVLSGPQVFGLTKFQGGLPYLSILSVAFLFFMAGAEIGVGAMRGPPLKLANWFANWLGGACHSRSACRGLAPQVRRDRFGFLIPIFFVSSSLQLDVRAVLSSAHNIGMMLAYAASLLLVRGAPCLLFRNLLVQRETVALGFYSATSLSLIIALTGTAVHRGMMNPDSRRAGRDTRAERGRLLTRSFRSEAE